MSQIKAGTYSAKVTSSFMGESKEKKTPYVGMAFQFEQEGELKKIEWVGYLEGKEGTRERSIKTVLECGYLGQSLSDLAGEFNFADIKNIEIVIEHETYINSAGEQKLKPKVKWVNVGGGANQRMEKIEAKSKIGSRYDGDLMRLRRDITTPMRNEQINTQLKQEYQYGMGSQQQGLTANDIPF